MSRDTKALLTFVITMVAVWVSFWVYRNGYEFIYDGNRSWDNVDRRTYGRIWGIFLSGIFVVFPTYKLTKKFLWKK